MSPPSIPITVVFASLALSLPARADLTVPLQGHPASRPADRKGKAGSPALAGPAPLSPVPRGAGMDRAASDAAAPRQLGVTRRLPSRGHAPMLPPVNDAPILTTPPSPPVEMEVQARLGRMTAPLTDVFRLPAPQSPWLGRLKRDQQVAIVSQWNGWFAIVMGDGSQAYVPQKSVEVLPYQVKTVVPTVPLAPPPAPKAAAPAPMPAAPRAGDRSAAPFELPSNEVTRVVIDEALRYRGLPYVWGGNGEEGFDCSGLVKHCFATRGIQLPRRAREQAQIGDPAPLDQLEAGDRLYFSVHRANDHTAIYLGNGYFVHASSSQGKVTVDHLSTPLYGKHLTSARRSP